MRLFNHTIEFPIQRSRTRLARIAYDDAFGDRCEVLLRFGNDIDLLKIGGTASTDVILYHAIVVEDELFSSHVTVLTADGQQHRCVKPPKESFAIGQSVIMAQHMDHSANKLWSFNYLATARDAEFKLNSVRVIGFCNREERAQVFIDPYTGQVNYGMDTARI